MNNQASLLVPTLAFILVGILAELKASHWHRPQRVRERWDQVSLAFLWATFLYPMAWFFAYTVR